MKRSVLKKLSVIILTAILALSVSALFACGGKKLPTTAYEKIAFAFDGVEESFRSNSANSGSIKTAKADSGSPNPDFDNALQTIRNVYENGDKQGDVIDELEYDQPPMIQFQCIKKVLEKTGANFSLGTKYYSDITGEMYMDSETGFQVESTAADAQDHRYSYVFGFAVSIDINDDDIITAEVSFKIHLERTDESYDTLWFVRLILDYDMKNATPNYSLTMLTENDETELPFYNADTYEYDFVTVKNNKINEWRKFCYSTDRKVIKDATHDEFADYIAEGIIFKADTCKWYENKNLRKITRLTEGKQQTIAGAFFGGIGLNSTDINAAPFVNKSGTQTNVINNLYSEMSNIFRKDVIYSLVCKDEDDYIGGDGGNGDNGENNGGDTTSSFIGIFIDGEFLSEIQVVSDISGERFLKSLDFYYVSETQGKLDQVRDFSSALFNFYGSNDLSNPCISLDFQGFITSTMLNILEQFNNNGKMKIVIGNAVCIVHIYYGDNNQGGDGGNQGGQDDQGNGNGSSEILSEMLEIGFLTYDTQKGQISAYETGGDYVVTVNGTNDEEIAAYITKLKENGFIQTDHDEYYAKSKNDSLLFVNFGGKEATGGEIRVVSRIENNDGRFGEWPTERINEWLNGFNDFPQPTDRNVFYRTGLYGEKGVAVYGLSDTARQAFFDALSEIGRVNNGDHQFLFMYEHNGYVYTIEINKNEYNLYIDFDLDRNPPQQIYNFTVQVDGTPNSMEWTTNETDTRIVYFVILKLQANQTIAFSVVNGNLSMVELSGRGLEGCSGEKTEFAVQKSGTYKFTASNYDGNMAEIRVEELQNA